jgi:hypothetical protein
MGTGAVATVAFFDLRDDFVERRGLAAAAKLTVTTQSSLLVGGIEVEL